MYDVLMLVIIMVVHRLFTKVDSTFMYLEEMRNTSNHFGVCKQPFVADRSLSATVTITENKLHMRVN